MGTRSSAVAAFLLVAGLAPARGEDLPEVDLEREGLSLGSRPGELLEISPLLWLVGLKARGHFGFGETGSRAHEPAFVRDLGRTSAPIASGGGVRVSLGLFGWI